MNSDGERRARVALSSLAKPGDPVLAAAVRTRTAAEVLALVTGVDAGGEALLAGDPEDASLPRWRDRLGEAPSTARLAAWQDSGPRLVMPGDAEWPAQFDDLGDARPPGAPGRVATRLKAVIRSASLWPAAVTAERLAHMIDE
jgi:DNA processing protein